MHSPPASDTAAWQYLTCWIAGTRLALSGELPTNRKAAARHLGGWVDDGITHIIDVRSEDNDAKFVTRLHPAVGYTWLGIDDDGRKRPDKWFDQGVAAGLAALGKPGAGLMVHCAMGMQRGPSMGYAIMLASGWAPVAALDAIVEARPIAEIQYADDAVSWWHRRSKADDDVVRAERRAVDEWLSSHGSGRRYGW